MNRLLHTIPALSIILTYQSAAIAMESEKQYYNDSLQTISSPSACVSSTIVCENGNSFQLEDDHQLLSPSVKAKQDGPIVYLEDSQSRLYSFEYDATKQKLVRTKIFRLPIIGSLYSLVWDNSNIIRLPKDHNGQAMKWAISYHTYPEGLDVRTISVFVMTNTNPIRIRNFDPWLPPFYTYEHTPPFNLTGIDIDAGGEILAIIGYNAKAEKVLSYRRITFDLTGSNPMISYRLPSGLIRHPSSMAKKLAEIGGVTRQIIDLPGQDWQTLILNESHQPQLRVIENGKKIIIPQYSGRTSLYDSQKHCWCEIESTTSGPLFFKETINWPEFDPPVANQLKVINALLDDKLGQFKLSSAEPEYGTFIDDYGNTHKIYSWSPNFLASLTNTKYFYDETNNNVKLDLLTDNKTHPHQD